MSRLHGFASRIRNHRPLILILSAVVVFVTTYMLILPALTLDEDEARDQGGIEVPASEQMVQDEQAPVDDALQKEPSEPSSGTISADNEGYSVSVDYKEDAGLSQDASVTAEEISADTKNHAGYEKAALRAVREKTGTEGADLELAKFIDITLHDQGEEVEPEAPVEVNIDFSEQSSVSGDGDFYIIHFTGEERIREIAGSCT